MQGWWRMPDRSERRRNLSVGFDTMEERVLMSATVAKLPEPAALQRTFERGSPDPGVISNANRNEDDGRASIQDGAKFVVNTVVKGRSIAYSTAVRSVGFKFAKLSVAHDTRKVGIAYLRAAIQGNGKTINHLNKSNLVKSVGQDFADLSRSPKVKKVGDAFASFGRAVARQFHHIFGK